MRRIHWRATAHRDQLMVRQEEQESTPEATVVLDRGVLRWSSDALRAPGADPAFEAAVSACVSVAARLAKEGYTVEVIDSDGTPLADPLDGDAEIDTLLARFATLTARRDDHLARLTALFAGVTTGPVILIVGTPRPAGRRGPRARSRTIRPFPSCSRPRPGAARSNAPPKPAGGARSSETDGDLAGVWSGSDGGRTVSSPESAAPLRRAPDLALTIGVGVDLLASLMPLLRVVSPDWWFLGTVVMVAAGARRRGTSPAGSPCPRSR